ncbi:MAG: DUF1848 family protein [Desulfobacterales bacterium]
MKTRTVISASRRTDIPAFYMDWFMAGIEHGGFTVRNPFNGTDAKVDVSPDQVHTIVFWSKDFGRFINRSFGRDLARAGYNLFFNFTINSESRVLEPDIAPLEKRLEQAGELCSVFGPQTLQWRFDPICFYRENGVVKNNLDDFRYIAEKMSVAGVRRCVTSFADIYAKMRRRTAGMEDFQWVDPPVAKKVRILRRMERVVEKLGMNLYLCCENEVLQALGRDCKITGSSCIPNRYLEEIFGGKVSFQKDAGQRKQKGCGCMTSKDIGGYAQQPCYHSCLYCYANPADRRQTSAGIQKNPKEQPVKLKP